MLTFVKTCSQLDKKVVSLFLNRTNCFMRTFSSTSDDHNDDNKCSNEIKPFMDIPYVDVYENNPDTAINIRDFCVRRKIILIGLPGAYTPICMSKHLPEYIQKADEFKKLGVDELACISVNDPYVMSAWGKHLDAQGRVRMFADTLGCLTNALGLSIDLPCLGGIRSKRYSMVLSNGRVQELNVEPDGIGLLVSRASAIRV